MIRRIDHIRDCEGSNPTGYSYFFSIILNICLCIFLAYNIIMPLYLCLSLYLVTSYTFLYMFLSNEKYCLTI